MGSNDRLTGRYNQPAEYLRGEQRVREADERFPGRVAELDEYPEVPYYSLDSQHEQLQSLYPLLVDSDFAARTD